MKHGIHISIPIRGTDTSGPREWILIYRVRTACIELLKWESTDPSSIELKKGFLTQSKKSFSLEEILESLKREHKIISETEEIHYRKSLEEGYCAIMHLINGAWMIEDICKLICDGYTHEEIRHWSPYRIWHNGIRNNAWQKWWPRVLLGYLPHERRVNLDRIKKLEENPKRIPFDENDFI